LILAPSEETDIKYLIETRFFDFLEVMNLSESIKTEKIIIDVEHWQNPPEDLDLLLEDLQQIAENYQMAFELRWGADKAQEILPTARSRTGPTQRTASCSTRPKADDRSPSDAVRETMWSWTMT
jgi:hypothetical protein